jgi:hypothetical protein
MEVHVLLTKLCYQESNLRLTTSPEVRGTEEQLIPQGIRLVIGDTQALEKYSRNEPISSTTKMQEK